MTSLSFGRKLGYGVGDFGFNLFFTTASLYLLYFYTDVLGLSPGVAGWVFGVALLSDAAFDPVMGYLANRTRTRWGRYRPYLLVGALPLGAAWALIFLPTSLKGTALILFAMAAHIVFRLLYAVVSMPFLALSAVLTVDSSERGALAAYRMVSAAVCGLFAAFMTLRLVGWLGGGATGFFWTGVLYGAVAALFFLIVFLSTREELDAAQEVSAPSPGEMWAMLRVNEAFWIVAAAMLISSVSATMFGKTLPYYFKYALGREDLISLALTALTAATTLSIPFWLWIMRRSSKRTMWLSGTWISLAALIAFALAPPLPSVLLTILAIMGLGNGAAYLGFWSMMPDTVEYGEFRSGIRSEGAVFGVVVLIQKSALGLAAVVLGEVLQAIGYRANVAQSPDTLWGMKTVMIGVPIVSAIGVAAIIRRYPIDADLHDRIVRAIRRRRRVSPTTGS